MGFLRLGCACLLAGAFFSPGLRAAQAGVAPSDTEQLQRQLDSQRAALVQQQRKLDQQRKALEETQQRLDSLRGAGTPGTVTTAQASPEKPVGKPPAEEKQARPPEVAPIFEQPGVLTPRGQFILEPSLQYSYATSNRVTLVGYTIIPAVTIGVIDVREVNSATTVAALTTRYGITNRLEAEIKVPYVYRNDDSVTRPLNQGANVNNVFNATGQGIGDVEAALRYQFNRGGEGRPYYVGSLRVKSRTGQGPFEVDYVQGSTAGSGMLQEELPTGSGFYGVQPGLSVIFPSDPAVFFGGVNYLWNFKRAVDRNIAGQYIGTVEPGNVVGVNLGMGLGLNERASFSIGYEHSVVGKTRIDGNPSPDAVTTQLGTLLLGWGYRYSPNKTLNLTLGAGLTRDTPDVQITLRSPISF